MSGQRKETRPHETIVSSPNEVTIFGVDYDGAVSADEDGSPVKPEAEYFVLRLDKFGDFPHVEAGRKAMKVYADEIEEHIPQLAKDLRDRYDLDRA